jgi:CubicO group peptidase (beta-lactamase class C family)
MGIFFKQKSPLGGGRNRLCNCLALMLSDANMKSLLSICFFVGVFISLPAHSCGQDSSKYHLDAYMQAAFKTGFNGNVLVAKKGRIIYQQAFGFRNFDTKTSLDNQSVFTICSVSKQFTAMAIMLLNEVHKLTLNDTLRQYFPELPYQHITIANMLDHTSGLPEYQLLMVHNWDHNQIANNTDLIKMLAAKRPPVFFKPGEKYRYSNTGYVLLASIIEKVSGQSYKDFINAHIFKPLQMKSSEVYNQANDHPEGKVQDYADGFMYVDSLKKYVPAVKVYDRIHYLSGIDGDLGVSTTTGDLLKWDRALKNSTLLSKEDQENMLGPHTSMDTLNKIYYGYGVSTGKNELSDFITHEGIWPGYRACFTRYIEPDITIIVFSNNESNAVGVTRALSYIAFGREVIAPYQHKEITLGTAELEPYVGTYLTPASVEFISLGGKLYRHRDGTPDVELKPESRTKFFYADASDRQVEFVVVNDKVVKAYLIANGIRSELVRQN